MFSGENRKYSLRLLLVVFLFLGFVLGSYQGVWKKGARKVTTSNLDDTSLNLVIVWDASRSMWGRVEGVEKIIKSREVLKNVIDNVPENHRLKLRIFGGINLEGGNDTPTVTSGNSTRQKVLNQISEIKPEGKSPIGNTLLEAQENLLTKGETENHILLVTDGINNGEISIANAVQKLQEKNTTLHIIHVGKLENNRAANLREYANVTGGTYYTFFDFQDFAANLRNY
ncbi:MAG: vWA domain-containing protein [Bacteroidales bacterium]